MSEDCPYCQFSQTDNCRGCWEGSHYKPKPITNADRIRAMTDEELAKFLAQNGDCPPERMFPNHCQNCDRVTPKVCYDCWLDWLRQEAV